MTIQQFNQNYTYTADGLLYRRKQQMKPLHIYSILIAAGFISLSIILGPYAGPIALGLLCLIAATEHKL